MATADPQRRRELPDGSVSGLYLVVQPSGKKSWALRYRMGGKPKKLTIGPTLLRRIGDEVEGVLPLGQPMTLQEARKAAREALQAIGEGLDPSKVKQAAKVAGARPDRDLVRVLGEQFIERYCKPRNRSWREVERQFKVEIFPQWGDRRIATVSKRDAIELLDTIVDRGSPMTANRVYATLSRFFGWLIERDVVDTSPITSMKKPSLEKSRDRILTDAELALFWTATEAFDYPFGPLWRLLALTGQRREEVAGMKRSELSLAGNNPVWVIPSARTKNGQLHTVPLAPATFSMIDELPKIGAAGFVFSTTGESHVTGYSRSKKRLDSKMLEILRTKSDQPDSINLEPWTLHDLRRTMATGMAKLGINLPIIEKCINHVSGSFGGIVGVYQHHDFAVEKQEAFAAWESHVLALPDFAHA